ncbi:SRPBCC family protein [Aeromicrobium sp.]|uniref:SRPBCC family protein n=1 Tax=Aeromicrobium sp. TaxID=1871063 RepID=UPI002FCA5F4F
MSPAPTGSVNRTPDGFDLVVPRTIRAPLEDVWASVTEPDRTARWFGSWRGEPGEGRTIELQMGFEEDAPWGEVRIEVCEPPRRLAITMVDDHGNWHLEMQLSQVDAGTEIRLVQHLTDASGVGDVGPGWEYYLDLLVAAHDGLPLPEFDDYYPAQAEHYTSAAARAV